jgi:hypothetical protein
LTISGQCAFPVSAARFKTSIGDQALVENATSGEPGLDCGGLHLSWLVTLAFWWANKFVVERSALIHAYEPILTLPTNQKHFSAKGGRATA